VKRERPARPREESSDGTGGKGKTRQFQNEDATSVHKSGPETAYADQKGDRPGRFNQEVRFGVLKAPAKVLTKNTRI